MESTPLRTSGSKETKQFREERQCVNMPLFKGANLLEELSFVFYYHSTIGNQILHLISFPIAVWGFLVLLGLIPARPALEAAVVPLFGNSIPILPLVLIVLYTVAFSLFDVIVAIMWLGVFAILFLASEAFINLSLLSVGASAGIGAGVTVTFLLLQLLGHVIFEKRLPAFRIFEFLVSTNRRASLCSSDRLHKVTTPYFLMLNFASWMGYRKRVRLAIAESSSRWKGTERRTFGSK